MKKVGDEIQWQGDLIAVVVGETEGAVAEGLAAIKVEYEPLDVFVDEENLRGRRSRRPHRQGRRQGAARKGARGRRRRRVRRQGTRAAVQGSRPPWSKAATASHAITHMCLEPHGSTCEWKDGKLTAHLSTQNVSGTAGQFAAPLEITADDVTVHCDYIGGGFGSKFAVDRWDVAGRAALQGPGPPGQADARPRPGAEERRLRARAALPTCKVGADKDGVIKVWDSHHWSAGGFGGGAGRPVGRALRDRAAELSPPRHEHQDQHRARRGPGVRPIIRKAVRCRRRPSTTSPPSWGSTATTSSCAISSTSKTRIARGVYAEEMKIAAKLMDWKAKWHPHGKGDKQGLGRQRPGHGHSHLGRRRTSVDLHGEDPSRRRRRNLPRQPGPGHRHAHRDRHRAGRNVRPAGRSRSRSTSAARSIRPADPRAAAPRSAA